MFPVSVLSLSVSSKLQAIAPHPSLDLEFLVSGTDSKPASKSPLFSVLDSRFRVSCSTSSSWTSSPSVTVSMYHVFTLSLEFKATFALHPLLCCSVIVPSNFVSAMVCKLGILGIPQSHTHQSLSVPCSPRFFITHHAYNARGTSLLQEGSIVIDSLV